MLLEMDIERINILINPIVDPHHHPRVVAHVLDMLRHLQECCLKS